MATASNNGSAYAYTTTLPTGDFRLIFWHKASSGVVSHTNFSQVFEVGYGTNNYVQLYSNSNDATPELRVWRNEAGADAQVIASTSYVALWLRYCLTRVGNTWTLYYAAVGAGSWTQIITWTNATAPTSLVFVSSYIDLGNYTMPGASIRSARIYTDAHSIATLLTDTLSATATLSGLWAAWFDGSTASLTGTDASGNGRTITVSGTFVTDTDDPITGGPQTITPGVLSSTILTPTLAQGNVNVAPGLLATAISTPSLSLTLPPMTPAVVAATLSAPSLLPGGISVVAGVLSATLATPTLGRGNVNLAPAALASTIATPSVSSLFTLAAALLQATLATPTLAPSNVLTPTALAASLLAPTLAASFTMLPAALVTTIASPTLAASYTLLPGALAGTVPTPTVASFSALAPPTLPATLATPSLAPGGTSVAPSSQAATLATPSLATGGASVLPLAQAASLFAPSFTTAVSISAGVLAAPAIPVPAALADSAAAPTRLQATLATPSLIPGGASVVVGALGASIATPAFSTSVAVGVVGLAATIATPALQTAYTLLPSGTAALLLAPAIEGQVTLNPAGQVAALLLPTFAQGGVSVLVGQLVATALNAPTLSSGGAALTAALLAATLPAPTLGVGGMGVLLSVLQAPTPPVPSFGAGGAVVAASLLSATLPSPLLLPGGVTLAAPPFSAASPVSPQLVVGVYAFTPALVAAGALSAPDVFHGGEVALPAALGATLPVPALSPGGVSIAPNILLALLQQPSLSNYYDDLPIPEDVNPEGVSLLVESIRVRSLDVDYNEISWRVANTLEDIFEFTFQVLRSEGPEGPFRPLSAEFQDRYLFIDNDVKSMHHDRRYYYKVLVRKRSSGATRLFGPAFKAPEADLIAVELRKHVALLTREFVGRPCWVFPVRTFGSRCRECFNPHLGTKYKSHCLTCYDTGFVGGYLQPIEAWISIDPISRSKQNTNVGPMQRRSTTARLAWWPPLKEGDVIIEPENMRWRVTTVTNTEQVRAAVHQEISLYGIESSDMEYRIPLKLDTALRDMWLAPARNMSNPQDLLSYENEDYPNVLQLYPTAYPKR